MSAAIVVSAAEILAWVEDQPAGDSGAVLVAAGDGPPLGAVLVERRRVCWVHVPGRAWRLRSLVAEYAGIDLDEPAVREVADRCRATGASLVDALGAGRSVATAGVRQAIYQHAVESLVALHGAAATDLRWVRHASGGYHAQDLYAPVHLLAAVGQALHPEVSGDVVDEAGVDVASVGVTRGAVVMDDDGSAVLVDVTLVAGEVELGVEAATRVAEWSIAALDACGGFSPAVLTRGAQLATGPSVLAWRRSRRQVRFAVIDLPAQLVRAVDQVVRARRPAVLAAWRAIRPA